MDTPVLIFDNTGKEDCEFRRDILKRRFDALKVASAPWDGQQQLSASSLVLVHESDCLPSTEVKLRNAATLGASVVFYTAGNTNTGIQVEGKGRIYKLHWQEIGDVLNRLPEHFGLVNFEHALASVRKRDVLNALAILAKCASMQSTSHAFKTKQEAWRSDQAKWLGTLGLRWESDVRVATCVTEGAEFPADLSRVDDLIKWLRKKPVPDDVAPSLLPPILFSELLTQVETKFGLRV